MTSSPPWEPPCGCAGDSSADHQPSLPDLTTSPLGLDIPVVFSRLLAFVHAGPSSRGAVPPHLTSASVGS